MALADLTEKIEKEAHERAEAIRAHAREEVARIHDEAASQKEAVRKEEEERKNRILTENERRILSSADTEVKAQKDAAKRAAIEEVFAQVLTDLNESDSDTYARALTPFLSSLHAQDDGVFVVPSARTEETQKLITDAGFKSPSIETTDAFAGGFIYKGGTYEYDCSFPQLVASRKSNLEVKLAEKLFGEKN